MLPIMPLSCCVSSCAALITPMRAEVSSGLARQRLQRGGEVVEGRLQRIVGAGLAVDVLKLLIELRARDRRRRAPRILDPQLLLHVVIELALHVADAHADPVPPPATRDLIDGLADIAGGVRIGDVAGDHATAPD